jgi:hypothetical protein
MREVIIKDFHQNMWKEVEDLPVTVTKRGKPFFVVSKPDGFKDKTIPAQVKTSPVEVKTIPVNELKERAIALKTEKFDKPHCCYSITRFGMTEYCDKPVFADGKCKEHHGII